MKCPPKIEDVGLIHTWLGPEEATLLDGHINIQLAPLGIRAATVRSCLAKSSGAWCSIRNQNVTAATSTAACRIYASTLITAPEARCGSFHIHLTTLRSRTRSVSWAVLGTLSSSTNRADAVRLITLSSDTGRIVRAPVKEVSNNVRNFQEESMKLKAH